MLYSARISYRNKNLNDDGIAAIHTTTNADDFLSEIKLALNVLESGDYDAKIAIDLDNTNPLPFTDEKNIDRWQTLISTNPKHFI